MTEFDLWESALARRDDVESRTLRGDVHGAMLGRGREMTDEKVTAIAAVVVITALSLYTGILRGRVRDANERASENLRRAEVCEEALTLARRSHVAASEAQGYADARRTEIEATRANLVRGIGAIVDSGVLDVRVCELARAAYHSALCAGAGGHAVPAAGGTDAP